MVQPDTENFITLYRACALHAIWVRQETNIRNLYHVVDKAIETQSEWLKSQKYSRNCVTLLRLNVHCLSFLVFVLAN